jgi:hypothetical protein
MNGLAQKVLTAPSLPGKRRKASLGIWSGGVLEYWSDGEVEWWSLGASSELRLVKAVIHRDIDLCSS